ncbi:Peptidase M48, Ste24p [Reinekea sp. MED297]|uniref:Peptidase M48, Ste24p n=1 Tax=Reinekea blandensis MED297 TaxID=314283 RepID=A4BI20_9GAMM|nr:Peptidase M48, Ste24p [Reinekea sp. MED297] [Reinekea blandensis MED297]
MAGVGYIGVLVGRMIKAAVSRQREYLADASSVQFTRNPDGLAGALYAIKQRAEGSQLQHRHAEDMSHFCFGETVALSDRLATHPPVLERIRRINPNFVAKARTKERQTETAEQSIAKSAPDAFQSALAASGVAAMAGQVTPDHVAYAQKLYQHIPVQMKNWVHQSVGARAFLYCRVMLGSDEGQRQPLLDVIKRDDAEVLEVMKKMWPFVMQMDEQLHLPLLELLIPTLKRMTETDRVILLDRLQQLIELDGRVDFSEWVTVSLIRLRLQPSVRSQQNLLNDLHKFKGALAVLFGVFVNLSRDRSAAEASYRSVCGQLDLAVESVPSLTEIGFDRLDQALELLDSVSFMWRGVILQGCADIIQADGEVGFREYEALRIIAECLDSPLPVLMIGLSEADPRDAPIPYTL